VELIFEDTAGVEGALFRGMAATGVIWVATLATAEDLDREVFEGCKRRARRAFESGVRLAAGGDTGTFNHGLNVREMEIMVEAGIPVEEALVAGTYHGWQACGGDASGFRFGWFESGNRADIVALDTDPREDVRALRKVSFVMKDGRVWKRDGMSVDMIQVPQWPDEALESSPKPTPPSAGSGPFGMRGAPVRTATNGVPGLETSNGIFGVATDSASGSGTPTPSTSTGEDCLV
jgi:hypothetical protein